MKNSKPKVLTNHSGVVLTTVMIVLLVMSIIISAVVFLTVGNLTKSKQTADHIETYYVAEGGINYLTQIVEDKFTYYKTNSPTPMSTFFSNLDSLLTLYPEANKTNIPFSDNSGKSSYALVWITAGTTTSGTIHNYVLHSEGYIGNTKRTLTKNIEVNYASGGTAFNNAFLAVSGTTFVGVQIHGPVQTTLTGAGSLIFGKNSSAYKVYIPMGTVKTTVVNLDQNTWTQAINDPATGITGTNGIYNVDVPTVKQVPVKATPSTSGIPKLNQKTIGSYTLVNSNRDITIQTTTNISSLTNKVYNLTADNPANLGNVFYVPNIKITQLTTNFTIQLDRDITLITDTLWLNNKFIITGPGKLTIYVKTKVNTNKSSLSSYAFRMESAYDLGNVTTPTNIIIYVADQKYSDGSAVTVDFSSLNTPPTFYLSVISSNLNYNLNTVVVNGALATNGLKVSFDSHANGKAMLIYAPNATITGKSSAADLYGAIIGKDYTNGAGGSQPTITYAPEVNNYVPADTLDLSGLVGAPTINLTKSATQE